MTSCAICLEHEMNTPAACVPCGHTFCLACITQWTRSPRRFSLSLCPQCRVPVREVQKLFISDWPVSSNGRASQAQMSPWEQLTRLVTLLIHYVSIPFNTLVHYGPELSRRVTVWLRQQVEQLSALRAQLIHYAVTCQREWLDLGRQAQCLVGAALLLVGLLLVQDLQDHDGLNRGIILPIVLVLLDVLKRVLFVGGYILYRPLSCVFACGMEVGVATVDVMYVVMSSLLWVIYDVICVPWLLVCVAARVLCSVLSMLAGVVRLVMFCVVLALSLGLPTLLAARDNQVLRVQLPELVQVGMEWLRQTLLQHTQQAMDQNGHQPEASAAPERRAPRRNIVREFLRLLYEELRNSGQDGQEEVREEGMENGNEEGREMVVGEREGEGWEEEVMDDEVERDVGEILQDEDVDSPLFPLLNVGELEGLQAQ